MRKGLIEKKLFVVDYIRKFAPVSRHVISKKFNMNPATIGYTIENLIADGIVMEIKNDPSKKRAAGRPAVGLKLNPHAGYFVGIDIYDRGITAILTDFECAPIGEYQTSFRLDDSSDTILKIVGQAVRSVLKSSGRPEIGLKGIGLGLPGLINLKDGVAIRYSRIANWKNIPFGSYLQNTFNVPVFADHVSNTKALTTAWHDEPIVSGVVATVLVRSGVSLGIVQNREIVTSNEFSAGELGHTTINFNGPECRCLRKGCLEMYASGTALTRIVKEFMLNREGWPGTDVFKKGTNEVDFDRFLELANSGDPLSEEIIETMFQHLCIGIDTVIKLFSPEVIIVSGIFNKANVRLRKTIDRYTSQPLPKKIRIKIEPYELKTGAQGAALLAATYTSNPTFRLPG